MKQTAGFISTYTADVFGVCSALYELGGMTIMHDASGCNSTYNTHDEPRWYDMNSMVYISGLSEMEAIMGDDDKLIHDITDAALDLSPKFIAIAGTPIPAMIGTDFPAIANIVEQNTKIPSFGFQTTGMRSYLSGVSMALNQIALRFVNRKVTKTLNPSVNLLGATPIDFSVNGTIEAIRSKLTNAGIEVISCWAMGSTLEELAQAGKARVNVVLSSTGLAVAKALESMFGTPYVIGTMVGDSGSERILQCLQDVMNEPRNLITYQEKDSDSININSTMENVLENQEQIILTNQEQIILIGEIVTTASLAKEIELRYGYQTRILCPLQTDSILLRPQDKFLSEEDDLISELQNAKIVIADPMYAPICPDDATLIPLPHEACSGRLYRSDIPNMVTGFREWFERYCK